jgi:transcriptional regulator with AAA-type ATPase domain
MIHNMENDRIRAKTKLENYIKNPGYFSILILGDSGTGKAFLIKEVLSSTDKPNEGISSTDQTKIGFFYPYEIGESEDDISKCFENEYIVFKNVEELSPNQQNILFKALSTTDGKIGLGENRGLKRVIFTSSFEVSELRESKEFLSNRFWDRISQLVIKIPSFKDFSSEILNDFKSVWEKMKFEQYPKLPEDSEFQPWLKENCGVFSGNFRDLDKIAILWHQYRLMDYENVSQKFKSDVEARIFRKVRADFEDFTHFPTQKTDSSNVFEFEKGKTWEQIERNFKSKFKNWVKNEYKSIKEATQELNMPLRKMDKW